MGRRRFYLSAILLLSIFLALQGKADYASAEEKGRITKGVFIDSVDVSGMTENEAEKAVNSFLEELRSKGIAIMVGENTVFKTLGDLGYTYEPNNNIRQALELGTAGNLIKRYKDLKDIEQGSIVFPLTFKIDEDILKLLIETEVSAYNIEPVNAGVSRKNGAFIYTDHVIGSKVDVEATAEVIRSAIIDIWNRMDVVVQAVMTEDMPIYTRDVVEKCNTILGTFTTEYTSSAEGRAANLANGARLINNTVLYPGEVFSAYEFLTPFTVDNGYYEAGAYSQGKVIDSIGGGACQVTTTLYNAVLYSELEIVERQPHSMTISYVDLSRDAAIAGTYKDLKFKNNTDIPILIEAHTRDRRITFNIWGNETRDTKNRRLEFVTVILSETAPPPDVIEEDPTKPTTYQKVTQSAHTGYKAELYKVVYENDKEVSRTLVNKSNYAAEPRYITVGTKVVQDKKPAKPTDTPKKEEKPADQPSDEEEIREESSEAIQSSDEDNRTNPDGQLQGEIYWDPEWDDELIQ